MYYDKLKAIARSEGLTIRDIADNTGIDCTRLNNVAASSFNKKLLNTEEQLRVYLKHFVMTKWKWSDVFHVDYSGEGDDWYLKQKKIRSRRGTIAKRRYRSLKDL